VKADSQFNATAIQPMNDIRYKLTRFTGRASPPILSSSHPPKCPGACRPGVRPRVPNHNNRSGSRFAAYSLTFGVLPYCCATCSYSPSCPALLGVVKANLESSSAEPLHSLPLATPEPAQVFELVLRHSCIVSGLDEGVLRKRLLLLFFRTRATTCHGIPATGRSG
jgi:hypothetical protein